MLFNDIYQLMLLLSISSTLIVIITTVHQICIKHIASRKTLSYNLYSAHRNIWIDAVAQVVIFLLFDWHIAVLLWVVTIPLSLYFFKYLYKSKACIKKHSLFEQKFQIAPQKAVMQSKTYRTYKAQREKNEDRSILFNTAVSNPGYHVSWLSVHLAAPALLWISILLKKMALLPELPCGSLFEQILYDIFCSYGVCSLAYWGGYLIEGTHYRFENWRRWYHVLYFAFCIIWWTLFALVEWHRFS